MAEIITSIEHRLQKTDGRREAGLMKESVTPLRNSGEGKVSLSPSEISLLRLCASSSDVIRDDGSAEFRHLVDSGLIRYAEMADHDGAKLFAITFSGLEALLGHAGVTD